MVVKSGKIKLLHLVLLPKIAKLAQVLPGMFLNPPTSGVFKGPPFSLDDNWQGELEKTLQEAKQDLNDYLEKTTLQFPASSDLS